MKDEWLKLVEQTLDEVLPRADARPAELSAALRYAVILAGFGKRFRSFHPGGRQNLLGLIPRFIQDTRRDVFYTHNVNS